MLPENLFIFLEVTTLVVCWALALVLFRVSTPDSVARKLSILLVVEGITLISSGVFFDVLYLFIPETMNNWSGDTVWVKLNFIIHTAGDSAMLALYPGFLAAALNTKLTRPFAGKRANMALLGASVLLFFAVQVTPLTVGAFLLYAMLTLLFGFSLVVAVHAWWVAPQGIARSRAGIFAIAFGFRDIWWGITYGSAIWAIFAGTYMTEDDSRMVITYFYRLSTLVYVPIVAYGILRTQLFDIDLKIRWTIKQSTLAGVFVAIMFVISEGASQFLEAELGSVSGLLAAGIVMFFLAPLQRFAERVASAAMPNTKNTPEYAAFRKMQVYESAVTEADQEGGISHKERALLVRLRDSLGISESDADAIERELLALPSG